MGGNNTADNLVNRTTSRTTSSNSVRQGVIDSAKIGLLTGLLTAMGESVSDGLGLATREILNTALPTAGSLMLGYLNNADTRESAAGILSANIAHRVAYYGTKGAYALMRYCEYQIN